MNKKIVLASAAAGCIAVALAAGNDPIVMTIGDIQVPRSEFEYLYNKNAQQQIGDTNIDDYAELFKLYKMKVADAKAEGIDTTQSFLNEFTGYRSELAAPYLTDSTFIKKMMKEAYDRAAIEVEATHIMKFKQRDNNKNEQSRQQLDSIREVLLTGGDFSDLAKRFSDDKGSANKGGYMGYITSTQYPYTFESAAYTLKKGEVSEVVESPQGYHILLGGDKRPASGTVTAEHILILVPDTATSTQQTVLKNRIDSIYNLAITGSDFEMLARKHSQDPGSAAKGGMLGEFGRGQMVTEFENAAFALKDGEISTPIRTRFGWHVIKKLGSQGIPSYEKMKPRLLQAVTRNGDARASMLYEEYMGNLRKKYNFKEYPEVDAEIISYITENGVDSLFFEKFYSTPEYADKKIMSYTGGENTVRDFVGTILKYNNTKHPDAAVNFVKYRLKGWKNSQLYKYEDSRLEAEHPEFRNLVNEYHDGMLLFEVSNRKVWEKATQNTEGLEEFFKQNRNDYNWSAPHVKGFLIQTSSEAKSDSIRTALVGMPQDSIIKNIKAQFPEGVKVEKILFAKGQNALVDALAFSEGTAQPSNAVYKDAFLYDFRIVMQPEEANDVRSQVTTDYQNYLEQEWVQQLRAKYPVTVNEKEMAKLRKEAEKAAKRSNKKK